MNIWFFLTECPVARQQALLKFGMNHGLGQLRLC